MSDRPTGTVTFLFTDIEGSTTRWEQHPQAMQVALARHDAILWQTIEAHGGTVFKTVGDAFYATFPAAPDALQAALAAQQALQQESWEEALGPVRVRMALHTGTAEARGGDYFGPALNRVARLLSAGAGSQILLSAATHELVRDHLPPGTALHDLGEHRLKDLIRPERVFQVVAPGLPNAFPPLKTLDNRPNNLPVQRGPLIGRERELAAVEALLRQDAVGLVTLTGPGGVGKTRLSLQVAADLLDDFPDGVFVVELAPIRDSTLVVPTIAQTLGVKESSGQPLQETLSAYLRDKQVLLVLDNFEQVVAAAPRVANLLQAARRLKVLVTSRALLRIYGEHDVVVLPLTLPDRKRLPPLEELNQYAAVRLFIERAQAAKADFQVTNETAPAVAEICSRLDGLPLAIELAAARIRLLPPQTLLARLDQRLKILTGGTRERTARQQTLRGAIDWSYTLLNPDDQTLFARLGVFVDGCTLEAGEAVCNAAGDLELDVLDRLQSLLDKSLLRQAEGPDGEPRFVMLETIHEYARERLETSGEGEVLRERHAAYFQEVAEAGAAAFLGAQQGAWLARLAPEQDNLRAALTWAVERRAGETALRLAVALSYYWMATGQLTEGRKWLQAALATSPDAQASLPEPGPTSVVRAKVLLEAAALARRQSDFAAARQYAEEALAVNRARGDTLEIAWSLQSLGIIAAAQGDYATAQARNAEALALQREHGAPLDLAVFLNNGGYTAHLAGDEARALALLEESLALLRELGDTSPRIAFTLVTLGMLLVERGEHSRAGASLTEGLRLAERHRDMSLQMWGLEGLACLAAPVGAARGKAEEGAERAARLFGAAAVVRETSGELLSAPERKVHEHHVTIARTHLDEATWEAAWAEGRGMTLEQAMAYALEETG